MKRALVHILVAFVLILSGGVFFGYRAYYAELDATFTAYERETDTAKRNIAERMRRMVDVFNAEVPLIEEFLRERKRTDGEITAYLQERTRVLSTGINANYIDLYLGYHGRYLCGNYWKPPSSFDITARPWYIYAMKSSGKTAIVPPYTPADYPHQVMAVSRRLESPDNVLAMDVQLPQLEPIIEKSIAGAGGLAFFIDPTGRPIVPNGAVQTEGVDLKAIAGKVAVADQCGRTDDGRHFIFHSHTPDGWTAVLVHNREAVLAAARWKLVATGSWSLLIFLLVVLLIEFIRYRSDIQAHWKAEGASFRGRITVFLTYLAVIAAFIAVFVILQRESTRLESVLAMDRLERRLAEIAAPYEAFINTAKGAAGYCSRHLEPLVLEEADDERLGAETKRLIGIYRSLYRRNYRNIFVARRHRYTDSLDHPIPAEFDPLAQDWYRDAVANPNLNYVYGPYVSPIDGVEQITITRVMTDPERSVVGIDISVKMLRTLCGRVRLPGARCAMVVAENGFIIDHHVITSDGSSHSEEDIRLVAERALRERHTFRMSFSDGKERLVFCSPLAIGGCVLITADADLLDNSLTYHYYQMLALLAPLFLSGLIVLFLTLRRIRRAREREIAERERSRQAESLAKALDLAESANRAKSLFLSSMSHDLRTPMNAIIGFADLASADVENAEHVHHCLEKISLASDHLLSLINDVLDMSRIESGRLSLCEQSEDIRAIFADIDTLMRSQAEAKSLDFRITVEAPESRLICDRLRLNQVVINLVSNAIKYTPAHGHVEVSVSVTPISSDQARCVIIVRDDGIGMSEEFVKTVFEPFTREQTSTVSGIQGSGLGMAIAKRLIDMKNGEISVTSSPGHGTTFRVEMNFAIAHD